MEDHRNHTITKTATVSSPLKWVGICLAVAVVILIAITVFNVPVNTVATSAIFLACPLLHIMMMKNGNYKH